MRGAKRVRATLAWIPEWEGVPKQWTKKFIRKNQWRCDRIFEFDDLMQEAYLVFLRITEKYPRVTEPRNFMGLYKTALANWFHDRSCDMTKSRRGSMPLDLIEPFEMCFGHIGELRHHGELTILLSEAPKELRLALALLAENPDAIRARPSSKAPRENLNMKLRRILGLDEKFDLKAALTELLFN